MLNIAPTCFGSQGIHHQGALYSVWHHKQICCHNTDYVRIDRHDITFTAILAKHCTRLPDDGSLVIRNMLKQYYPLTR